MTFPGTNFKPAKGQHKVDRAERKSELAKVEAREERKAKLERRKFMQALREAAFLRDKGACRCCGVALLLEHPNPARQMQLHHIVYRSAGGKDVIENVCCLCWACHKTEHAHAICITGSPMPGSALSIEQYEDGRVLQSWESVCPS